MLGPFRIRNLRRPSSPTLPLPYAGIKIRSYDAVVSLTGQEYDSNVQQYPESKLKYVDQDDGDTITVGSQLELAQRLQEPVPQHLRSTRIERDFEARERELWHSLHWSGPEPMHVFEVDRKGESSRIWEQIEKRTKELYPAENPTESEMEERAAQASDDTKSGNGRLAPESDRQKQYLHNLQNKYLRDDDLSVQVDESDDTSRLEELREARAGRSREPYIPSDGLFEDLRNHWFHATNPPRISEESAADKDNDPFHNKGMRLSDVLNDVGPEQVAKETAPLLGSFHEGNLTAEGKRQAMEAGNRMRHRTNPIHRTRSLRSVKEVKQQEPKPEENNRWASYNSRPASAFVVPSSRPAKTSSEAVRGSIEEAEIDQAIQRSLLETYKSELAKLARPDSSQAINHNLTDTLEADLPEIDQEVEGSLLQTFKSELAKIARPDNNQAVDNNPTDTLEADLPERPSVPENYLQATTRKLVLQSITSMVSNATTLTAQLREFVIMQMMADSGHVSNTTGSEDRPNMEHTLEAALVNFESSVSKLVKRFETDPTSETNAKGAPHEPDKKAVFTAVGSLHELTSYFDQLCQGLQTVDASENGNLIQNNRDLKGAAKNESSCDSDKTEVYIHMTPIPRYLKSREIRDHLRQIAVDVVGSGASIGGVSTVTPGNDTAGKAICCIFGEENAKSITREINVRPWGGVRSSAVVMSINSGLPKSSTRFSTEYVYPAGLTGNSQQGNDGSSAPKVFHPSKSEIPKSNTHGHDSPSLLPTTLPSGPELVHRTVRFQDPPSEEVRAPSEVPNRSRTSQRRSEPLKRPTPGIVFRHVPSPMPYDTEARSHWQSHESFRDYPPPPYSIPRPMFDPPLPSKPRPFSMVDTPQRSRSRSRSPNRRVSRRQTDFYTPIAKQLDAQAPPINSGGSWARQNSRAESGNFLGYSEAVKSGTGISGGNADINHGVDLYDRPNPSTFNRDVVPPISWHSPSAAEAPLLRHSNSMSALRRPRTNLPPTHRAPFIHDEPEASQPGKLPLNRRRRQVAWKPIVPPGESSERGFRFVRSQEQLHPTSTRYPTLEQLETKTAPAPPQFPQLPSMKPLVPSRPNAPKPEPKDSEAKREEATMVEATNPPQWKPHANVSPQRQHRAADAESSGDFFHRMTGLRQSPPSPISPERLGPAPPEARLAMPFDPQAEAAIMHRHQLMEGVRRSATVSGLHDRFAAGPARRPYSAYFDGSGRVEWDSFIRPPTPPARATSMRNPHQAPVIRAAYRPQSRLPVRASMPLPAPVLFDEREREREVPVHQDPMTVDSVQACVEELKKLGFGREEGGVERLVVYAQAAEGDLEDAIDLIEEERLAYAERG